ncbi:hypothetical protein MCAG_03764 [Micromonospora sp. ATCC 39149]|nr:hypothetical protein MCAG_03764 [Micromonospora sp. ATCC 39149]
MAGIGWVFGYGIVTPVFSARAGGASSRRIRLRRLAGTEGELCRFLLAVPRRPLPAVPQRRLGQARAYAAVRINRALAAILSLRRRRFRDATDCA